MTNQGLFITFEGLDGAGKSTQISRLQTRLESLHNRVVITREPGGTAIGDEIRALVLSSQNAAMAPRTEALLYAASRAQLLHDVVRPALAEGAIVLCDRYLDASLAYQGAGLGLGVRDIYNMNQFATEGLQPHLTVLFDLPVKVSQERVQEGRPGDERDRIEQRDTEYFRIVREQFLAIARTDASRVKIVEASLPVPEVEQEIWHHVENCMSKYGFAGGTP